MNVVELIVSVRELSEISFIIATTACLTAIGICRSIPKRQQRHRQMYVSLVRGQMLWFTAVVWLAGSGLAIFVESVSDTAWHLPIYTGIILLFGTPLWWFLVCFLNPINKKGYGAYRFWARCLRYCYTMCWVFGVMYLCSIPHVSNLLAALLS